MDASSTEDHGERLLRAMKNITAVNIWNIENK
jgi:hypothetical protein